MLLLLTDVETRAVSALMMLASKRKPQYLLGRLPVAEALFVMCLHFAELDRLAAVSAAGCVGVGQQRRAEATFGLVRGVERTQRVRTCSPLPENEIVRHICLPGDDGRPVHAAKGVLLLRGRGGAVSPDASAI